MPEWISCGERLPTDSTTVLAFAAGQCYAMQHYAGDDDYPAEWACAQGDGWGVPNHLVTHWMPMPQPPAK
jgi:hypothetical protein